MLFPSPAACMFVKAELVVPIVIGISKGLLLSANWVLNCLNARKIKLTGKLCRI